MSMVMKEERRFGFTKEERVKGRKRVETLFADGASFLVYPFKVIYVEKDRQGKAPFSILISVPKKRLKSAVLRNRVKRMTREAYRLQKNLLECSSFPENRQCDVAFVYVKDRLCDYPTVEKAMRKSMEMLNRKVIRKEVCGKC